MDCTVQKSSPFLSKIYCQIHSELRDENLSTIEDIIFRLISIKLFIKTQLGISEVLFVL